MPKIRGFDHHHSTAIFLHIPIRFNIADQWIGYKFDFARMVVKQDSIALPFFFPRLIVERHF